MGARGSLAARSVSSWQMVLMIEYEIVWMSQDRQNYRSVLNVVVAAAVVVAAGAAGAAVVVVAVVVVVVAAAAAAAAAAAVVVVVVVVVAVAAAVVGARCRQSVGGDLESTVEP